MRRTVDVDLIRKLRLEGKTIREISVIAEVAQSTVERYLGLLHMTHNQANWVHITHREDEAAVKRWAKAMPYGD